MHEGPTERKIKRMCMDAISDGCIITWNPSTGARVYDAIRASVSADKLTCNLLQIVAETQTELKAEITAYMEENAALKKRIELLLDNGRD